MTKHSAVVRRVVTTADLRRTVVKGVRTAKSSPGAMKLTEGQRKTITSK